MTKKIFRSIFLVALIVLLASTALIGGVMYSNSRDEVEKELKIELSLAATGVENEGVDYLESVEMDKGRLTYVDTDGTVLYDSKTDASKMENHASREEIKEAFETGEGESSRYSKTLTEKTMYYATRLDDGTVLRISANRDSILRLTFDMLQHILLVLIIALVFSLILASIVAQKVVKPLNDLDLEHPLENDTYEEVAPFLNHIEHQQKQIRKQSEELEERRKDFDAVTKHMNEGLVLLGENHSVISINPAAKKFFGIEEIETGSDFIAIERDLRVGEMLEEAGEKGYSELQMSREGREYQLNATRIESGDKHTGMVILIFDITERAFAERNRREFTANVSHELKTPLHSIMGNAELIENGLVKEEGIPEFAGKVRKEAERLVSLIDDIIRLSRLDEETELPEKEVELHKLAENELASLKEAAARKNVKLSLQGDVVKYTGAEQLLHEAIYNLCDNAIKYNKEGGSVTVKTGVSEGHPFISVADTGIGIPVEDIDRIFERFYRVDKSHSKESGGTGLGLSIVKHAVSYMKGSIDVDSTVGEGTTITIKL